MSSKDLDHQYKLLGKRMAWALGYVPLLNVPITLPNQEGGRAGADLTDADVLGLRFNASGGVSRLLIDCKTTTGRAVDRVLWVRGLKDFLKLDELYLFKKKLPENARWLAHELDVRCLDESEQADFCAHLGLDRLKGPYFDGEGYSRLEGLSNFPKNSDYRALAQFLNAGVWTLPPAQRVVTLLSFGTQNQFAKKLRPKDLAHVCLVLAATRCLAISLGLLLAQLNVVDVLQIEKRLREELHGGAEALAQKTRFAEAISRFTGEASSSIDHENFDLLLEQVHRLLTRRFALNDSVRTIDLALHYCAAGTDKFPRYLSGPDSGIASKLASDILTLLVRSNGLAQDFSRLIIQQMSSGHDEAFEPAQLPQVPKADGATKTPSASVSAPGAQASLLLDPDDKT